MIHQRRGKALWQRPDRGRGRVLFIDDTAPLRMIGSGFVRSNDLIRTMLTLGFRVTVFPLSPSQSGPATIAAEMPDEVEVLHSLGLAGLGDFLRDRGSSFDAVWIARTHNLDRVRPELEKAFADMEEPPLVVLDTEAVVSFRNAARARLEDQSFDLDAATRQEFRNAGFCQRVVAVTEHEAEALRGFGLNNVRVIGHAVEAQPTTTAFGERNGMLFMGAIHDPGSPNHDALTWFIKAVLPLIEEALGWETRLTVAGYVAPCVTLDVWRRHPRVTLLGPVADAARLYASNRVFIAPTRFAAGLPYKVHEAAAFGLPAVVTTLLAGQLGWADGEQVLAADTADAAGFAAKVVRLYREEALWKSVRSAALSRIAEDAAAGRFEAGVSEVLATGVKIDMKRREG